jgi:nucleotide-binding universal stress UspA family protein
MKPNAHVVVGVDFSEASDLAVDGALGIAAGSRGTVHAVHVISPWRLPMAADLSGALATEQGLEVARAGEHLRQHVESRAVRLALDEHLRVQRIRTYIRVGPIADSLTDLAAEVDADLVVVGTRGRRGVSRLLLGSTAESTARLAQCPVLVMRPKRHELGAARVPEIEPPCPRCVQTRQETQGARLWCDQHSEHHEARHHYHQGDRTQTETSLPLVFPMR